MWQAKLKTLGLSLKPGEGIDRAEAIKVALEIGGSSRWVASIKEAEKQSC